MPKVKSIEEIRYLFTRKGHSNVFSREAINRFLDVVQKEHELLEFYRVKSDFLVHIMNDNKGLQENYMKLLETIDKLEKELVEMK